MKGKEYRPTYQDVEIMQRILGTPGPSPKIDLDSFTRVALTHLSPPSSR